MSAPTSSAHPSPVRVETPAIAPAGAHLPAGVQAAPAGLFRDWKRWTQGEIARLGMLARSGATPDDMGRALGRKPRTVLRAVYRYKFKRPARAKAEQQPRKSMWTVDAVRLLIRMKQDGALNREIAAALNIKQDYVEKKWTQVRAAMLAKGITPPVVICGRRSKQP